MDNAVVVGMSQGCTKLFGYRNGVFDPLGWLFIEIDSLNVFHHEEGDETFKVLDT